MGARGRMTTRKGIRFILGAAVLGGVFYLAVWPFVVGGKDMQAFCENLALDASLSRVRDMAKQNGYRMMELGEDGRALIHGWPARRERQRYTSPPPRRPS